MLVCGWKQIGGKEYWIVSNSWGTAWGENGNCYITENYPIYEMWAVTDRHPSSEINQPTERLLQISKETVITGNNVSEIDIAPFYVRD